VMSVYLSVIGGILSSQKYIEKLFCNVLLKNSMFLQLTELHTRHLFEQG
jgi:S-adenosylmethionine:diacylglycerol 3-amino-3-carboxypropyl transferase